MKKINIMKPNETINSKITELLEKGEPIEFMYAVFMNNAKLKIVNPRDYKEHKGLKMIIAVVEKENTL